MKYLIPLVNLEKLQKKINRVINKGAPITFEIGNDCFLEVQNGLCVKAKEVFVEGSYKINGWEFVGTIEHKEKGNIIRCINSSFEGRIPDRYRTCAPYCEHCQTMRVRKNTYLIFNTTTNEFKQVGKSCLLDFTNGLDAEVCAQVCSVLKECEESEDKEFAFRDNSYCCVPNQFVKGIAYAYVKEFGYTSGETTKKLLPLVFGKDIAKNATAEEISNIDSWVAALKPSNSYLANAKIAWESSYCESRDIALIASLISVYLKEKAKKESLKNEYLGNVGDKITFSVKSKRTLFTKGKFSYYGPMVFVYEIISQEGNTIVWSTSSNFECDDTIEATIKALKEYKGIKQTIITRGHIIH